MATDLSFPQVEVDKYEKGIIWLRELLYQTEFTKDRLKIVATQLANDVAKYKRNGSTVAHMVNRNIIYNKGN